MPAELQIPTKILSSSDTITRIEKRIENKINAISYQIQNETNRLAELQKENSKTGLSRKQDKILSREISLIEKNLQLNHKKLNACNILLTQARQLRIRKEPDAIRQMREIDMHLIKLDKNKLPGFLSKKTINNELLTLNTKMLYAQPIFSFCNLNLSSDGKIMANAFENFFSFTDPEIASHYQDNDFLDCQARFIKTRDDYFLELKLALHSPRAAAIFGNIDGSSPSRIDFIDGDFIYLDTHAQTSGILDAETGSTIHHIQYRLNKEDLRNLRKKNINTFTILWTRGADQFEIYKIDLLKNLFECLQEKKLPN